MRLRVDHETRYSYEAPVAYGLQQVRLRPKDTRGQKVMDWSITVDGGQTDAYAAGVLPPRAACGWLR